MRRNVEHNERRQEKKIGNRWKNFFKNQFFTPPTHYLSLCISLFSYLLFLLILIFSLPLLININSRSSSSSCKNSLRKGNKCQPFVSRNKRKIHRDRGRERKTERERQEGREWKTMFLKRVLHGIFRNFFLSVIFSFCILSLSLSFIFLHSFSFIFIP